MSGQCSKIGENRGSDSARDSGERIPSNFVINGVVSESQGCGRVVSLSMRKILEKLTWFLEKDAFSWPLWKKQEKQLVTNLGPSQAPWESSTTPGKTVRQHLAGAVSACTKADSIALFRPSRTKNAATRRQSSTSTSNKIGLKFRVCSWSGDA